MNIKHCNTHKESVWINKNIKIGFLCIPKVTSSGVRVSTGCVGDPINIKDVPKDYKILVL